MRIEHYFLKWVELSDTAEDFNGLKELILREQILNGCSPELVAHLKERKLHSTALFLKAAEVYREARAGEKPVRFGFGQDRKWPRSDRKPTGARGQGQVQNDQSHRHQGSNNRGGSRETRECFLCHKRGHVAKNCRTTPNPSGALQGTEPEGQEKGEGQGHRSDQVSTEPTKSSKEEELVTSVCHLRADVMPVAKGWIGGQEVEVLRDTLHSSAVVQAEENALEFAEGARS